MDLVLQVYGMYKSRPIHASPKIDFIPYFEMASYRKGGHKYCSGNHPLGINVHLSTLVNGRHQVVAFAKTCPTRDIYMRSLRLPQPITTLPRAVLTFQNLHSKATFYLCIHPLPLTCWPPASRSPKPLCLSCSSGY